ncbi:hypothetical protein NBRC116591_30610 [Sessilibacter corallicola]|uniref:Esterase n=1 Tax=Sessilibacter corallicola TaxID=2904075 RepID=A0ABQ0AC76_9GAMM
MIVKITLQKRFLYFLLLIWAVFFLSFQSTKSYANVDSGNQTLTASISDLFNEQTAKNYASVQPLNQTITWQVYLPENYSPENPPGLLVYISPGNSGEIPDDWQDIMDELNLIWIGADNSGNNVDTHKRLTYALLAPRAIAHNRYPVNPDRVYLSGFSGGGRVASLLASDFPSIFKGAIYNSGANKWLNMTPEKLEVMKNNRYVFITGREDFNLNDTKRVYRFYKKAGLENLKLKVISRMGHDNPSQKNYAQAIKFIDASHSR